MTLGYEILRFESFRYKMKRSRASGQTPQSNKKQKTDKDANRKEMDAVQEEKEASTPQKKGASKLPSLTEEQIKARFEGTIKSVNYRHFIGQSSVI